jgi:uncharacterized protein YjiS (DUF1127 family)
MSQSLSIKRAVRAGSIVAAGQAALSNLAGMTAIWFNRRQGRQDLRELDDRLLADVGISREDAVREAGKPFWRTERRFGEPASRSGALEPLIVIRPVSGGRRIGS